ncbi:MAG: BLUF domain-containing protein [Janthinobacterium lividum]
MKYIIYISTASIYFEPETLEAMLLDFRKKNKASQITGMMLFNRGKFLQVLEGNDKEMDTLVKKIKKDKRHHSIIQLGSAPIQERIFKNWSMGFKIASDDEFKSVSGYVNPIDPEHILMNTHNGFHPAVSLLKNFAETISAY